MPSDPVQRRQVVVPLVCTGAGPAQQRALQVDLETWVNVWVNVLPFLGDIRSIAELSGANHLAEVSVTCALESL